MRVSKPLKLVCLVALIEIVGSAGTVFTAPAIGGWYASLHKPPFTPPNWVFAPVWLTLFALIGASLYLALERGKKSEAIVPAMFTFAIQMLLNVLWSALFFGLHSPLYGLICIAALLVAIAANAVLFFRISRLSGLLLLPYLSWVVVAMMLNLYVVLLN
jgi:tryptophan-rich sensory protein